MKKIHCSYADKVFEKSLVLLEDTSINIGGVDEFYTYRPDDLHEDNFFENNKNILTQQLGAGFWAWKPFIILQTIKKVNNGDIVLYTDAGVSILENLDSLFNITEHSKNNRMLFGSPMIYGKHLHSIYTKRDCFVVMGLDEPKYWNTRMLNATFSLWMKTKKNIDFLNEWLKYTTNKRAIWDTIPPMPSDISNLPDFAEHRYDQAILSLLSVKYGRELYRDPSQLGNNEKDKYPNSPYGQLFNHHSGNI